MPSATDTVTDEVLSRAYFLRPSDPTYQAARELFALTQLEAFPVNRKYHALLALKILLAGPLPCEACNSPVMRALNDFLYLDEQSDRTQAAREVSKLFEQKGKIR